MWVGEHSKFSPKIIKEHIKQGLELLLLLLHRVYPF